MPEFENQQNDALHIEAEIGRMLVALKVDPDNEQQLRAIAHEALAYAASPEESKSVLLSSNEGRVKLALFGLIALMLTTMQEGALLGEHIRGNDLWKALARALWKEKDAANQPKC